jgi:hypothetical protein
MFGQIMVVEARGAACAGATDPAACAAAFASARIDVAPGEFDDSRCSPTAWCPQYFVTTTGNEVNVVASRAALLAVTGGVTTRAKAFVHAWANDYGLLCAGPARARARAVPGGWEVVAAQSTLCGAVTRFLLFVGADGRVRPIAQETMTGCR